MAYATINFFDRSQCQLTRLVVHSRITRMIIDIFKMFGRTLVELTVIMLDFRDRDSMIDILLDYIANSTITTLPSLRRLVLQTHSGQKPACEQMLLSRVVNWRDKGVARLEICFLLVMEPEGEAKADWTSIRAFEGPEYRLHHILLFIDIMRLQRGGLLR